MRKLTLLTLTLLFVFVNISTYSQVTTTAEQEKIENIKKNQFIYMQVRGNINFYFTLGINGPFTKWGKNGAELEKYIKNDSQAYAEFKKGMAHRKRSKLYKRFEFLGYIIAAGSCVPLVIGLTHKKDEGVTPPLILGGIGVVGGFVVINVFNIKSEKQGDAFIASINNCVAIYNQNLLLKNK